MPQVTLANTQCSLLADICDAAVEARDLNGQRKLDTGTQVELTGLADMLRKANGTYEQRPDGPPLTGRVRK